MDQPSKSESRLFPTKTAFLIFWSYISLFVSQGLLVTAVQKSEIYGFSPTIVVLLTELVKLLICVVVYLSRSQRGGLPALLYDVKNNKGLLLLYLVPAFLYCLYNNLTFINLELFDLATYYCLMQFRIVLTAIIYQVLFRRQLNPLQWTSLLFLTTGCLIKEYGIYDGIPSQTIGSYHNLTISANESSASPNLNSDRRFELNPVVKFFWSTSLLLLQMFCSCFAGVYNEYLLKDSSTAKNADVILQNIFMYVDSIICNLLVLRLPPSANKNLRDDRVDQGPPLSTTLHNLLTSPLVIILIFNNALLGLVASFFLKSLNSISKTFASALELFGVTFLGWILFNNAVDIHTIIALILVTAAMILYSKNPVSVASPDKTSQINNRDGFILLPTTEE